MHRILALLLLVPTTAACARPHAGGDPPAAAADAGTASDASTAGVGLVGEKSLNAGVPGSEDERPVLGQVARARLLDDLAWLADDARGGRGVGTPENAAVRDWIAGRFVELGLETIGESHVQPFETRRTKGANVVGVIEGTSGSDRTIVITAHFDHLGTRDGVVFNGADDNASGTAALLAAADWFRTNRPTFRLVFVALDAEEHGLQGARAFVASAPIELDAMAVNVNMDMVGRNERGELYVSGTFHTPELVPILEPVIASAPVRLVFGHDRPGSGSDDWTHQSDHAAFHDAGIPFLYFGVEDHDDYHRPTDDLSGIQPEFFVGATESVIATIEALDAAMDGIPPRRR